MPIVKIAPGPLDRTPPGPVSRLAQTATLAEQRPPDKPAPRSPSWGDTWAARAGTTLVQSVADQVARWSLPTTLDPSFNAYREVANRPDLLNDPVVQALVERGQFDASGSPEEFAFDLATGRRFFDDVETLERASMSKSAVTFAGAMLGDPTNLIPVGGALAVGRTGSAAMRAARAAAVASGTTLAIKKTQDALTPAGNDPGLTDEAMTAAMGAGLGAGLNLLFRPVDISRASGWLPTAKARQLRADLDKLVREPMIDPVDPVTVRTDADLARVTLADEIAAGRRHLDAVLSEAPVDQRTVSVLHVPGDDNAAALDALRASYDKAGKVLRVVEHPSQWFYSMTEDVRKILDHPAMQVDASPADLDLSAVDAAVSGVTGRYANLLAKATPGGRIAQTFLAQLNDVHRTLAGSAQTMTRASAVDPLGYAGGAAAENLKGVLDGVKDAALVGLRGAYRKVAKSTEPITYAGKQIAGRFGLDEFSRAVLDVMRRDVARSQGFAVADAGPVHPIIREGVASVRAYFRRMRDELEQTGLLTVGPRALKMAEADGRTLAEVVVKAERRVADLTLRHASDGTLSKRLAHAEARLADARSRVTSHEASVRALREAVTAQDSYLPRVFNIPAVLADERGFKAGLVQSFRRADAIVEGVHVADDARPLVSEVAEKFKDQVDDLAAAKGADVGAITEGDLPDSLRTAYRAELDAYYRRGADAAFDSITRPTERHGVAEAIPEDSLRRRVMTVDDADIAPFLEPNLELIVERYARVIGGRTAVRRAIQLNEPLWRNARVNGKPIESGADLMEHLRGTLKTLDTFARTADAALEGKGERRARLAPMVRTLRSRVEKDVRIPLDLLEGRNPIPDSGGVYAAASYFGRQLTRLSFLNKLGSVAIAQLNDLAPATLYLMQNPRQLAMLPRAVLHLRSLPKQDLEAAGLVFDAITRTRALADVDYASTGAGFGEGWVRRASGSAERGIENLVDLQGKVTLMNWITDLNKRVAGGVVLSRLTTLARQLAAVERLKASGMSESASMAKVHLRRLDAAWANKLGLNGERSKQFERLLWEHGLTLDDRPIREVVTWDDFVGKGWGSSSTLKPNFAEWPTSALDAAGQANRNLFDTLLANVHGEVARNMVVKPGAFDRPLTALPVLGRMFHQLQSFAFGFVNQRLKPMSQLPAKHQLWYAMSYLSLGAMADAISNELAGRRSLEDTAKLWAENPLGAVYGAWDRSGLAGWLGRPLAVADAMGMPWSPGNLTGNTTRSTAAGHVQSGRVLTYFGPVAADADRLGNVAADVFGGRADERTAYTAWKLAPFQNLVWWRLLNRATGLPVVPEAMTSNRR